MPSHPEHPRVSVYTPSTGKSYELIFKLHGKQKHFGTGTNDYNKAKSYALAISKILVENLLDDPPSDTPKIVLDMLGIKSKRKKLAKSISTGLIETFEALMAFGKDDKTIHPLLAGEKFNELFDGIQRIFDEAKSLKDKLAETQDELSKTRAALKIMTDKATAYEAIRVKEGREIAKSFEPRTLKQAIGNYLSEDSTVSGTDADDRYRPTIRMMLDAFAEKIGENVVVLDVPSESVIKYLSDRKDGQAVSTVKQIATYVCSLLEHQSGGLYPLGSIRAWIKTNLVDDKAEEDWYWLEPAYVESLLKKAEKADGFAQYWTDAMRIQHHLALRPEEIIMLQNEKVYRDADGKISHIHLCPLTDGGIEIRRLKTRKSKDSLPVTSETVREAIERRLKSGNRLLFPRIPEECGCRKPRWKATKLNYDRHAGDGKQKKKNEAKGKFEDDHKLWREKMWCRFFLERLRAAAKKVKGIDLKRLDSRTLRRTRGRDIVLATRSIYETAKFMRDDPATVEKHYAELLPMDVKVG